MSRKQLSPTSFAILGLLSIQPFTTYELAQQMDRTLSWFWPRAASMIYEEPKKLVTVGLATSQVTFTGKRRSTVYKITDAGRAALRDWLDTPAAGMRMEFEAMLKVAFADAGDVESATCRRCAKSGPTLRRDSLKSSTDQRNTQPQAARSQTDCQSLRSPASCSWANTRLLSGGPDGPKTRSMNGRGVTPATGATVPPYAFTSGWPAEKD